MSKYSSCPIISTNVITVPFSGYATAFMSVRTALANTSMSHEAALTATEDVTADICYRYES